jgi:predicted GIY-YIG superfamily endonuclease
MRHKWTYEECKEEALKYTSRKELRENCSSVYYIIWKNKWSQLFSHMELLGNRLKRLIYVYEFTNNTCYIGLTGNIKKRQLEHIKEEKSSVYRYIKKTGLSYNLVIKTDYIDVEEASKLEGIIKDEYESVGWAILNRIKTGAIGHGKIKWDYEACKKEALKYKTMSEFIKNKIGAYSAALNNNWLNEICSHFDKSGSKGYWNNKELCKIEATKYNNKSEFRNNNWAAYNYSKLNGWLDEFFCNFIKKKTNKPLTQYNMKMEKINEFPSLREASKKLKMNNNMISSVCLGKKESYKGYIFRYK